MRRWEKTDKAKLSTHQMAYLIYQDILLSLESYTDDSVEAKFFLPEEISEHCKAVAASFAIVLYTPQLSFEEISGTRLYYLYYLSLMYGAQIFLKEYSMRHNHTFYRIEHNQEKIEEIKNTVTSLLGEGERVSSEGRLVIDLYKQQLSYTKKQNYLQIEGRTCNIEDFDRCLHGALLWGYLFAKEMLIPYHEQDMLEQ